MTIKNKLQQRSQQELIAFINHYRANGLNMIPVKAGDKKPYVPWEQYQKRKSTQKEIEQWFLSGAGFNIGIVCGQISGGLVVVDIDAGTPRKAVNKARKIFGSDRLQHTFVVKTSKGVHVYWKVRQPVSTTHFRDIGVDLQAEGAYVLAPPSLHPSGTKYQCESLVNVAEWTEGDFMEELLEGLQRAYGKKFDAESYRQPVDVARLLKGVPKGERNVACIQLATWHRTKGKSKEETLKLMLEWNKCNEEPLPEKEVRRTVESAYKKKEPYKYKFIEVTEEVFPEEVHKEAEQLLKQPNIIPAILKATEEVVEEENNRISIFLLNLVGESFDVSGESGSGKNTLVEAVLNLFPKDSWIKMTAASAKVLRYLKQAPTLYFAERRAYQSPEAEESITEYDIKVAISEGKLVTYVTAKDTEKGYVRRETKIRNFIMTSTEVDITEELKNRIWQLTTDDSPEHISKVVARKLEEASKLPHERINTEPQKRVFRCAVKKLWQKIPKAYVIPFSKQLRQMLSTEPRANRDVKKLKQAIYASAALHYYNREKINLDGEEVLVCTPEDLYNVLTYMKEAVYGTFSGGAQTRWFKEKWRIAERILDAGKLLTVGTYMLLAKTSWRTAHKWLTRFEEEGLLVKHKEKGKTWYTRIEQARRQVGATVTVDFERLWQETLEWMQALKMDTRKTKIQEEQFLLEHEKTMQVEVPLNEEELETMEMENLLNELPDAIAAPEDWQ